MNVILQDTESSVLESINYLADVGLSLAILFLYSWICGELKRCVSNNYYIIFLLLTNFSQNINKKYRNKTYK